MKKIVLALFAVALFVTAHVIFLYQGVYSGESGSPDEAIGKRTERAETAPVVPITVLVLFVVAVGTLGWFAVTTVRKEKRLRAH